MSVALDPFADGTKQPPDIRLCCRRFELSDCASFLELGQELTERFIDLGETRLDDDLDAKFLQRGKQRFPFRVSSQENTAGPMLSIDQRALYGVGQQRGK